MSALRPTLTPVPGGAPFIHLTTIGNAAVQLRAVPAGPRPRRRPDRNGVVGRDGA